MKTCVSCIAILLASAATAAAQRTVSQADLLRRVTDLDRFTRPPGKQERVGSFASFDRTGGDDDHGQFLGKTEDGWDVMAELDRPGAIVRIWTDRPAGKIRFVLDGKTVIDAPFDDLFNGALAPFGTPFTYQTSADGGKNCYYPIGFSKSCRILSREFGGEYQIGYVTFGPRARVERFQPELDEATQKALEETAALLQRGLKDEQLFGERKMTVHAGQEDVAGGKKFTWEIKKPGTIRALLLSLTDRTAPRMQYALHNCTLRIYWDAADEPDVEVPLAEFFGAGFNRIPYRSLPMGTNLSTDMPKVFFQESQFMYCYFPMPFKSARIEIENNNKIRKPIGFMLYMRVDRKPPPRDSLRFKARFHVEDPCTRAEFPVLRTSGAGYLVGCSLNVDSPRKDWWGAGDHEIRIDGEDVPSIRGTDTSGYFGSVKGLSSFAGALHGVTLAAPFGKSSAYRWQISDAVPFHSSIEMSFENLQNNDARDVYYASVAYWYGQAGAKAAFEPLSAKARELPGLRMPGAVEVEGNVLGTGWGRVFKQQRNGNVEFSSKAAANITTSQPVRIKIPVEKAGEYILKLRIHPRRSFTTINVARGDGRPIGVVTYNRDTGGTYDLGRVRFNAGDNIVSVQCGKRAILDCWLLEPAENK